MIEPQIPRHIQLRGGADVDRRDGVVRLIETVLPVVSSIQVTAGVQDRPIGHVQGAQRLVAVVAIGAVRRHIDGLPKVHGPRPVHRDHAMRPIGPVLAGDIQSPREIGNGRAVTDREVDVLVALVAHVKAAPKLHHAAHRLRGKLEVVGGHGIGRERPAGVGGTAAQSQVVGHVDLRANVDVQIAAQGEAIADVQVGVLQVDRGGGLRTALIHADREAIREIQMR